MLGFIVRHQVLGLGKVVRAEGRTIAVRFDGRNCPSFDSGAIKQGTLTRVFLPVGTECKEQGSQRALRVESLLAYPPPGQPATYMLSDSAGAAYQKEEVVLWPGEPDLPEEPQEMLAQLYPDEFPAFKARDGLLNAYARLLQQAGGLSAMLASRVDLRPHQIFVAGSVLLDRNQRYLLADEVGLGKTIEAGLVLCDLLSRDRDARVLILAPSALTRQWLAELYSKFGLSFDGGRAGFTLLDLHDLATIRFSSLKKVIASTRLATFDCPRQLCDINWDMVVVDEVHQLLACPRQYDFVLDLARQCKSLLLLSAMPARHRETELFRLLALLDPQRFDAGRSGSSEQFLRMYNAQSEIGRRVQMLSDRVTDQALPPEQRSYAPADIVRVAKKLAETDVINGDQDIAHRASSLNEESPTLTIEAKALLQDVVDRYRVHRRILRNRRQKLQEEEQVTPIERKAHIHSYDPTALESEAHGAVADLLSAAAGRGLPGDLAVGLGRVMWHAAGSPASLRRVLRAMKASEATAPSDVDREELTTVIPSYADWSAHLAALCGACRSAVTDADIEAALDATDAWHRDKSSSQQRLEVLIKFIRAKQAVDRSYKLLIFAGFPGTAAEVAGFLKDRMPAHEVAEFRDEMDAQLKEQEVRRFRRSTGAKVLVSDESGGEGRNFQFATELLHFDTPWYISSVEQRIGRLDRLGREECRTDVISNVLVARGTVEHALVQCYDEGVKVYHASISGLEFALREVENELVRRVLRGGAEALAAYAVELPAVVDQERARDESEVLLDEAMALDPMALRSRTVRRDARPEQDLEWYFGTYYRNISGDRPQSQRDIDFDEGIWKFSPGLAKTAQLHLTDQAEAVGTFRRSIAQQRPDLQFFSVGNVFFDAVLSAALTQRPGRAYAVECACGKGLQWSGFEFIFRATADLSALEEHPAYRNQANRVFSARRTSIFVGADGVLADEVHQRVLRDVRNSLRSNDERKTWWSLNGRHGYVLDQIVAGGWRNGVAAACETARVAAKTAIGSKISYALEAELRRVCEAIRQSQRDTSTASADEVAALEALDRSVANWQLHLDAAGFLSVNGNLRSTS